MKSPSCPLSVGPGAKSSCPFGAHVLFRGLLLAGWVRHAGTRLGGWGRGSCTASGHLISASPSLFAGPAPIRGPRAGRNVAQTRGRRAVVVLAEFPGALELKSTAGWFRCRMSAFVSGSAAPGQAGEFIVLLLINGMRYSWLLVGGTTLGWVGGCVMH